LNEEGAGPSDVIPAATIFYRDYLTTRHQPPALLAVEVLSFSNEVNKERDLVTKVEIYAALEIPAYWVIDRRDQSVWVYTQPHNGQYAKFEHCCGETVLEAPGLEIMQLTPVLIFAE
jgi:Uma2 family endonuclease